MTPEELQKEAVETMFDTDYMTGQQPNCNQETLETIVSQSYQAGQQAERENLLSMLNEQVIENEGYFAGCWECDTGNLVEKLLKNLITSEE